MSKQSEAMKWERVVPPLPWPAANALVVADRHLPDGTRQHMIQGSAKQGLIVDNAQVIGEDDQPDAEFSDQVSHLSDQRLRSESSCHSPESVTKAAKNRGGVTR